MDGSQPVSHVTLQMLNSLINTQTRLRDAAEARWVTARESLFNLARLVAADWLEQKQHEKGGLDAIRIEELTQMVYQQVSTLQAVALVPVADQLKNASSQNEKLSREVENLTVEVEQGEKLKRELETVRQKFEKVLAENDRLKNQVDKLQTNQPVENNEAAFPAPSWFQEWAECGGFEKQSYMLKLIGSTGISLRQEILKTSAKHFEINEENSKSLRDALDGLASRHFITLTDVYTGERGRPALTASLTALGEAAFIFLTRELPRIGDFEAMRPHHSTDEHTVLVIQAVNILEAAGYEIVSKGEINILLENNRLSSPDILARKDGREIFIEVERDVNKGNRAAREQKWQNAFDAGQGSIYLFCETPQLQKRLVQEINHALASEGRLARANTFMTNLEDLQAGQRHSDGSIWLSQKRSAKPSF
jgi:predicted RecB family endonuclease